MFLCGGKLTSSVKICNLTIVELETILAVGSENKTPNIPEVNFDVCFSLIGSDVQMPAQAEGRA